MHKIQIQLFIFNLFQNSIDFKNNFPFFCLYTLWDSYIQYKVKKSINFSYLKIKSNNALLILILI